MLAHLPALVALTCPTVNSYRRLQPQTWSSAFAVYGHDNREAALRIASPFWSDVPGSVNLELKAADATCNPYLALAVMLRAGLDGIQRKLPLPPAMDESLFLRDEEETQRHRTKLLPATLGEALEGLREDSLIRETLGDSIYEGFIEAKSIEWIEYRKQVHAWELERYLPVF